MRKHLALILTAALAVISCGKKEAPKALVIYYSQLNSTKTVAEAFAAKLGAPLVAIEPVVPYEEDFGATAQRGQEELRSGHLPEIKPLDINLAEYDVIFLGFPIWFGTYAPPVKSFLATADLKGKKIVPFCTFGSGGLDSSSRDLAEELPESQILPGYGVRAARLDAVDEEVDYFLKSNGYVKGKFTPLPEFSAQAPVTGEETVIFHDAVDSYGNGMIRAEPTMAASRAIPGGREFLFSARSIVPEGQPAGTIQVYVKVPDGGEPVFTEVLR